MQTRLIFGCFGAGLIALLLTPVAGAQMRGGFSAHPSYGGRGAGGFHHSPRFGQAAFFGDPYYYDDYAGGRFIEDAPPQFFVLQQPAVPEPPKAPIHPLLIELQGDRYVRVGEAQGNDQMAALQPPSKFIEPQKEVLSSSSALTPTVLIYRNGVRESIPQYAIVGKVIYARGNYWQDGYWTKNIEISALNLPATIQVNQDNGVRFTLPAGPSEVVTRP
jgi:hypothetical protein